MQNQKRRRDFWTHAVFLPHSRNGPGKLNNWPKVTQQTSSVLSSCLEAAHVLDSRAVFLCVCPGTGTPIAAVLWSGRASLWFLPYPHIPGTLCPEKQVNIRQNKVSPNSPLQSMLLCSRCWDVQASGGTPTRVVGVRENFLEWEMLYLWSSFDLPLQLRAVPCHLCSMSSATLASFPLCKCTMIPPALGPLYMLCTCFAHSYHLECSSILCFPFTWEGLRKIIKILLEILLRPCYNDSHVGHKVNKFWL